MKAKIAGVALAAVMACGWASGARALTISGGGNTIQNGSYSLFLGITDMSDIGHFTIGEFNQDNTFMGYTSMVIDDSNALITSKITDIGYYGLKTVTFDVSNPYYHYEITDDNQPTEYFTGYEYKFSLYLPTSYYEVRFESAKNSIGNYPGSENFTVVGDPFITTVPLPQSSSMLSVALLVLGGISYTARRKREVTAR